MALKDWQGNTCIQLQNNRYRQQRSDTDNVLHITFYGSQLDGMQGLTVDDLYFCFTLFYFHRA